MPMFIIRWDSGYGDDFAIIDAENEEDALDDAYQRWLDYSSQDYAAIPYSDDAFEELNLERDHGLEKPESPQ